MSNIFRKVKAKYCLVQFSDDDIYYVCYSKNLKRSKQGTIIVKWQDGYYYNAKFLASSNNPRLLKDILKSLDNNIPIVSIKKLRDIKYRVESSEEIITEQNSFENESSNEIVVFDVCNNCFLLYPSGSNHICDEKESTNVTESQLSSHDELDFEKNNLCMYCGVFVANIKEHIVEAHGKYASDDEHERDVKTKFPSKRHYCIYCNTLQTKLARHLERKHTNELDVQEAIKLSKGSRERKSFLLKIQKKADFLYNTSHKKPKEYISLRRNTNANDTTKVPCPYCQGFYSKTNIRNHVRLNCWKQHSNKIKEFEGMGFKNLQVMSRSLAPRIHEKASKILKEQIFPVLNDDEITRAIADDELVITYANLLVMKYSTSNHHHNMIRNKIRHISRILLAMRKIDSKITNATSIFDPSNFDTFISAVHTLAGLNDGKFSTPSLGPTSVTLICQLGDVLQVESIKKKDVELENNVKQFLKLLVTTASALITKTATENRTQNQRSKIVVLPKTEDVNRLYHCLEFELERCSELLKDKFDHTAWTTLSKVVLIKLLIFNRKRPGDIERSQIIEYNNIQTIDSETLKKLDANQQKYAAEFSRYITRGKLDSPAAVLVPKKDKEAIELILKYRLEAKVEKNNPYLFAAPRGLSDQFYKAGKALQEFCYLTNLENKNLTATKLRKHLATVTCTLNDDVVKRISNFMGHSDKYHHNIYVQRPIIKDVIEMGEVLTNAVGNEKNGEGIINDNFPESNCEKSLLHENIVANQIVDDDMESNSEYSDYLPELSRISEELSDCETASTASSNTGKRKKKRNTVIKRSRINKKATWTTPERTTVRNVFKQYFVDESENPSLETCEEFLQKNSTLKNRSAVQVRSWIIQEKKRINDRSPRWSTPIRQLCRKHFKSYYENETYPSSVELEKAIQQYPELGHTSIPKLRSHLQHDYKYLKRKKLF